MNNVKFAKSIEKIANKKYNSKCKISFRKRVHKMSEKKGLIAEFKEFISKGNVMDLAVGVIIGGAFQAIVTSLCDDVINPAITLLVSVCGGSDLTEMAAGWEIKGIKIGSFISAIINFLIMAIIIFAIVKSFNKLRDIGKKPEAPADPTTKECPFCLSEISIKATRCPHCTSQLDAKKVEVDKKKK